MNYLTGRFIEICGLKVSDTVSRELISSITEAIANDKKLLISYANANTINLCHSVSGFRELLNSKFLIHPDGVGVYLSSKFLYGRMGLRARFSGSDFYPKLIECLISKSIETFFFGHRADTLQKINNFCPGLLISGYTEGYDFNNDSVVNEINHLKPSLLIVGLGQPVQEKWISDNFEFLNVPVIIAVGDGIKVFAGEKERGPVVMQKLGLEWLVRLFLNPARYFRRYVIGIPVFLCRIIWAKLGKLWA